MHFGFAFMHGIDQYEIGKALMCNLFGTQELRNNANGLATFIHHTIGYSAHQSYFCATIDQLQSLCGKGLAQCISLLCIDRFGTRTGTTEYGNTGNIHMYKFSVVYPILRPLSTDLSIVKSVTSSAFTAPSTRHSLLILAICFAGKLTTAIACLPTTSSGT
ncbi:hypothetical protein D3C80_1593750 [compost metagenome]